MPWKTLTVKSIAELQNQLNMRRSQIDQVLKVLSVEVPSPAIKVGSKWHRTAAEFELDRERIHRLSVQREREWQEFQEYVDTDNCFMEYLGYMLDDPTVERCGKCANCMGRPVIATTVKHALEVEAVRFLRRSELPFEPRKRIEKGTLPTYGFPDDRLVPGAGRCRRDEFCRSGEMLAGARSSPKTSNLSTSAMSWSTQWLKWFLRAMAARPDCAMGYLRSIASVSHPSS